jgi:hypothetical protein
MNSVQNFEYELLIKERIAKNAISVPIAETINKGVVSIIVNL